MVSALKWCNVNGNEVERRHSWSPADCTRQHHAHDGFRESPLPLTSSTFISETPPVLALQRRHNWHTAKCLQYPKKQLHTTTLGCGANTDRRILQRMHRSTNRPTAKEISALARTRSEEERQFKVQLQWPSCSCAVYTLYLLFVCNNNVQFYKNKLLLLMICYYCLHNTL